MKRIGISGASGYVGTALLAAVRRAGDTPVAIGRKAPDAATEWRFSLLENAPADDLLHGLDALLHLAADTRGELSVNDEQEVSHAVALARQAAARGIPMLFVSSQAASASAPGAYGRNKWAIEAAIASLGAISIRPGLVVGGPERGLFGLLCGVVRRSPLLPTLLPAPQVQPVHIDDLTQALLRASHRKDLAGRCLAIAGPPMPFHTLLAAIATQRLRRQRLFLPLPGGLLRLMLRILRPLLGPAFSPQRFDSLLRLPRMQCEADLQTLGMTLRHPATLLERRSGSKRRWLREAQALSCAMLGRAASFSVMRRYSRLLPRMGVVAPLDLPPILLRWPVMLAALDTPASRRAASTGSLAWRMGVLLQLAEADPQRAADFLGAPTASGLLIAIRDLLRATGSAVLLQSLAPLAKRLWRLSP
ncbi:MAG: NAD-dependent epimerase/dehydratase family protein [Pseudomarimonas sp.]